MTYKPEVDGLRTVAMMMVLFCHMQLNLPGGFIGVDIFFVISGFLITSALVDQVAQNRFSVWQFYGRRFIRLYPALIVTVLLTVAFALLLFDAEFVKLVGHTAKYTILSVSNLFFTRSAQGYFDYSSLLQPFLHTWSLGVEWQFYLVWPFLVWGALKISRQLLIALLIFITLGSLVLSQWMIGADANAAYYQMPSRAFELGIGALLVFVYHRHVSTAMSTILLWSGFLVMLACALIYTPQTPFPGIYALIPCLATAACIYGGKNVGTGNFLRLPIMVYLGKISYSSYLVHWPLVVFYQYYIYRNLYLAEKIALVLASLALGAISYHLIEQKFSWKRIKKRLPACLYYIAFIALCLPAFNYLYKSGNGLPGRIPSHPYQEEQYTRWGAYGYASATVNRIGKQEQAPIAILTGDSFAGSLVAGMDQALQKQDTSMLLLFEPGCLVSVKPRGSDICKKMTAELFEQVKQTGLPVVLAQAWGGAFSDNFLLQNTWENKTQEEYHEEMREHLGAIKAEIGDSPLIIIGSIPYRRWGFGDQECLQRPDYVPRACERMLTTFHPSELATHKTNAFLRTYAQQHEGVYYIDVEEQVCPDDTCTRERTTKMFFDSTHLSIYGSNAVAPHVLEQIDGILRALTSPPVP